MIPRLRAVRAWLALAALVLPTMAALPAQSAGVTAMIADVVRTGSLIVRQVHFDLATDAPTPGSEAVLSDLLAMLREHDEWTFEVQVHTDETGAANTDLQLSAARASAVVHWLVSRGIADHRLVPRGYGSSRPLRAAPSGDPQLRTRRVELRKVNEE